MARQTRRHCWIVQNKKADKEQSMISRTKKSVDRQAKKKDRYKDRHMERQTGRQADRDRSIDRYIDIHLKTYSPGYLDNPRQIDTQSKIERQIDTYLQISGWDKIRQTESTTQIRDTRINEIRIRQIGSTRWYDGDIAKDMESVSEENYQRCICLRMASRAVLLKVFLAERITPKESQCSPRKPQKKTLKIPGFGPAYFQDLVRIWLGFEGVFVRLWVWPGPFLGFGWGLNGV